MRLSNSMAEAASRKAVAEAMIASESGEAVFDQRARSLQDLSGAAV